MLKEIVEESREHLANIETDLLTILENGRKLSEGCVRNSSPSDTCVSVFCQIKA
jgi:hypothetical protein